MFGIADPRNIGPESVFDVTKRVAVNLFRTGGIRERRSRKMC